MILEEEDDQPRLQRMVLETLRQVETRVEREQTRTRFTRDHPLSIL